MKHSQAPSVMKKTTVRRCLLSICLMSFCLLVYHFSAKSDFHNDEYTSFTIANNAEAGMITTFTQNVLYDNIDEPYMRGMVVQPGHSFEFGNVLTADAQDTLPPLYYLLLHVTFSCFPGTFSIWYAAAVNIPLYIACILLVYYLARLLGLDEPEALTASALFAFLPGTLEMGVFIRMYLLTILWTITLGIGCVLLIDNDEPVIKASVWVFISLLGGALTHYYYLVLAFFMCLATGVVLLWRRQWKRAVSLVAASLLAGIAAVAFFPAMLRQLFSGRLNNEGLTNLAESNFCDRAIESLTTIDSILFGGLIVALIVLLLVVCVLKRESNSPKAPWIVMAFSTIAYFVFIAKSAFFINTRYFCPIYPLLICGAVATVSSFHGLMRGEEGHWGVVVLAAALFLSLSYREYQVGSWFYAGRESEDIMAKLDESYRDRPMIVLYENGKEYRAENTWMVNRGSASVVFTTPDTLDDIVEALPPTTTSVVVEIDVQLNQEECLKRLEEVFPQMSRHQSLGGYPYYSVYAMD